MGGIGAKLGAKLGKAGLKALREAIRNMSKEIKAPRKAAAATAGKTAAEEASTVAGKSILELRRTKPAGKMEIGQELFNVFEEDGKFFVRQADGSLNDVTKAVNTPGSSIENTITGEQLRTTFTPELTEGVQGIDKRLQTLTKLHGGDEADLDMARTLVFRGGKSPEEAAETVLNLRQGKEPEFGIPVNVQRPLSDAELLNAEEVLGVGRSELLAELNPADARDIIQRAELPEALPGIKAELERITETVGSKAAIAQRELEIGEIDDLMFQVLSDARSNVLSGPVRNGKPINAIEHVAQMAEQKGLEIVYVSKDEVMVTGIPGVLRKRSQRFNSMDAAFDYVENYNSGLDTVDTVTAIRNILDTEAKLAQAEGKSAKIPTITDNPQGGFVKVPGPPEALEDDMLRQALRDALDLEATSAANSNKYFGILNQLKIGTTNPGDLFPRKFADLFLRADRQMKAKLVGAFEYQRKLENVGLGIRDTLKGVPIAGIPARKRKVANFLAFKLADAADSKWFKSVGEAAGPGKPKFTIDQIGNKLQARKGANKRILNRLNENPSAPGASAKIRKAREEIMRAELGIRSLRHFRKNKAQYDVVVEGIQRMRFLRADEIRAKREVLLERNRNYWSVLRRDSTREGRIIFKKSAEADAFIKKQLKRNPELTKADFLKTRPGKPNKFELAEELGDTVPAYITHLTPNAIVNDYLSDELPRTLGIDNGSELARMVQQMWIARRTGEKIPTFNLASGQKMKEFEKMGEALQFMFRDYFDRFGDDAAAINQARSKLFADIDNAIRSRSGNLDKAVISVLPRRILVPYFNNRIGGRPHLANFARSIQAYTGPALRAIHYEPAVAQGREILLRDAAFNDPLLRRAAIDWQDYVLGRFRPPAGRVGKFLAWITGKAYRSALWFNFPVAAIQFTQPLMFLFPEVGGQDFIAGAILMRDKSFLEMVNTQRLLTETVPFEESTAVTKALSESWNMGVKGMRPIIAARRLIEAGVTLGDLMAISEGIIRKWALGSGISKWMRLNNVVVPGASDNPAKSFQVDFNRIKRLTREQTTEMMDFAQDIVRRTMFLWSGIDRPAYLRALETAGEGVGLPLLKPLLMFTNFPANYANRLIQWTRELRVPGMQKQAMGKLAKFAMVISFIGGPGALEFTKLAMNEQDPEAGGVFGKVLNAWDRTFNVAAFIRGAGGPSLDLEKGVGLRNVAQLVTLPGRFAGVGQRGNLVYSGLKDLSLALAGDALPLDPKAVVKARSNVFGTMPVSVRTWAARHGVSLLAAETPTRGLQTSKEPTKITKAIFGKAAPFVPGLEDIPPVALNYIRGAAWGERVLRYWNASVVRDIVTNTEGEQRQGVETFLPFQEGRFGTDSKGESINPLEELVAVRDFKGNIQSRLTRKEQLADLFLAPPKAKAFEEARGKALDKQEILLAVEADNINTLIRKGEFAEASQILRGLSPALAPRLVPQIRQTIEDSLFSKLERRQRQTNPTSRLELIQKDNSILADPHASEADRARALLRLIAMGQIQR